MVSPVTNCCITRSSSRSFICPCPTATRARGTIRRRWSPIASIVSMRLCTKNTCPPRSSSRAIASSSRASSNGSTKVSTGERSRGGVCISVRSRSPASDWCSVRGMGVAVSVSTSVCSLSCLSRSLCFTPKRCSSSTMMSPSSANATSGLSSRWVPMRMSIWRALSRCTTAACSLAVWKRDITSTVTGKSASRSPKERACCSARMVVGTSTATCRPPCTALKAARMAISVLPYPTSPTSRRSMGRSPSRSPFTSSVALRWSGVSSNRKALSSCRCHAPSGPQGGRVATRRRAYRSSSSCVISRMASRVFSRCCFQRVPPSLWRRGGGASSETSVALRYRSTWSMR